MSCSSSSDVVDFFLNFEAVKTRERKTEEQADSAIQHEKRLAKCALHFILGSADCSRVRHSPMGRDGLPGPDGTNFLRRVVANGEHEVQGWRAGFGKLLPTLAAQAGGGKARVLKFAKSLRANLPCRMAACAVRREGRTSFEVQDRLGHDGARRVSGAQEQDVVMFLHCRFSALSVAARRTTARVC